MDLSQYICLKHPNYESSINVGKCNVSVCRSIFESSHFQGCKGIIIGVKCHHFLFILVPVFQVVRFPNDICIITGGAKNGTCYTAYE